MQRSQSVYDFAMRGFQMVAANDVNGILSLWSHEPGVMGIGTDPSEWWTDFPTMESALREQFQSGQAGGSGTLPADLEIEAYEEGTVGWFFARYTSKLPNGAAICIRWTNVVHQESGAWKLVGTNVSVAMPDNKVMEFFQPG